MLHFFTAPLPIEAFPRTPVSMPSPPPLGRVTRVLLGGAILLSGRRVRALSARMLVFLHLPLTQRGLQSLLTSALPGVKVTTVGRVADFERSLSQGQDVVLTLPIVLSANGLSPALRGHRGGRGDEAYAVVGLNSAPDPQRIKVIGALDLLGRAGTNAFVEGLLGRLPKVERVTKVEDLLALLQMQRADAILLPERLIGDLRQVSRLNLVQTTLSRRVQLPAATSTGPGGAEVLSLLKTLKGEVSRVLGVDDWR